MKNNKESFIRKVKDNPRMLRIAMWLIALGIVVGTFISPTIIAIAIAAVLFFGGLIVEGMED